MLTWADAECGQGTECGHARSTDYTQRDCPAPSQAGHILSRLIHSHAQEPSLAPRCPHGKLISRPFLLTPHFCGGLVHPNVPPGASSCDRAPKIEAGVSRLESYGVLLFGWSGVLCFVFLSLLNVCCSLHGGTFLDKVCLVFRLSLWRTRPDKAEQLLKISMELTKGKCRLIVGLTWRPLPDQLYEQWILGLPVTRASGTELRPLGSFEMLVWAPALSLSFSPGVGVSCGCGAEGRVLQ